MPWLGHAADEGRIAFVNGDGEIVVSAMKGFITDRLRQREKTDRRAMKEKG